MRQADDRLAEPPPVGRKGTRPASKNPTRPPKPDYTFPVIFAQRAIALLLTFTLTAAAFGQANSVTNTAAASADRAPGFTRSLIRPTLQ